MREFPLKLSMFAHDTLNLKWQGRKKKKNDLFKDTLRKTGLQNYPKFPNDFFWGGVRPLASQIDTALFPF